MGFFINIYYLTVAIIKTMLSWMYIIIITTLNVYFITDEWITSQF